MFTLLWLTAVAALTQNFGWESSPCSSSGDEPVYPPAPESLSLSLGPDYQPFWFGTSGTFAFQSFAFYTGAFYGFRLVDAFCAGDTFAVYANGIFAGTCDVVYEDVPLCDIYTTVPEEAELLPNRFCQIEVELDNSSFYNITIQVVDSPLNYGQAFVRLYLTQAK